MQFQTHYQNGTMMLCHTSCDILNMGTLQAYLEEVAIWMRKNPYDVVTILMGNFDYVSPQNFTAPIMNSGLQDYVYTPTKIPMALDDWPTLSEMILTQKRLVFFLDYQANQTAIPWLMDEFSQMWETPFSPTNDNFPCTQQRPPGLSVADAKNRMYMANHNLNLDLNLGPINLLIPNSAQLNQTNGVNGTGSLGWMAENCTRKDPAFLSPISRSNRNRPMGPPTKLPSGRLLQLRQPQERLRLRSRRRDEQRHLRLEVLRPVLRRRARNVRLQRIDSARHRSRYSIPADCILITNIHDPCYS